jgi:uncharacterized protein
VERTKNPRSFESERLDESQRIVELLLDRSAYEEHVDDVECVETHISWVFLTDQFVYKLKKPVRFDFLDFSTSELRRTACEDEVRLNRRLARHVYLGVLPVTLHHGRLSLNGEGTPIDWVVKMSRLPANRSLDRLIRSAEIGKESVQQVAQLLSRFFTQLPPLTIRPDDYRRRLKKHVRQNRDGLLAKKNGIDEATVRRLHESQLLLLQLAPEMFDHRVLDGRIVEGHGDLRPEHIYLTPSPTIIDCIEFSTELRQLDVVDELCFLAMECDQLNAAWIGDEILAQYRSQSGDDCPQRLAAFYKSYRACVRAKVSLFRAEQLRGQTKVDLQGLAAIYLQLADSYRARIGKPVVIIVRGLTGTGKTTLARELAERLEIERFETDAVRRQLFGKSDSPADFGEDIYRPENRERVYEEVLLRAKGLIDSGRSAIIDGTFLTAKSRLDALALAASGQAVPLVVDCHCPDYVARQRIADRLAAGNTLSESRREVYEKQKAVEEGNPVGIPVCQVDTTLSLPAMVDVVLKRLKADWKR